MPFWPGLRSGKGAPLRGRLRRPCLRSRPCRVPCVALSGYPAPLSPAAPVLPAGPPSAPAPAGRLRCRRLRPLAPGGKTHAPQGIRAHGHEWSE